MRRAIGAACAYTALFAALGARWLAASATALPTGDPFSFANDARLHTWVTGWIAWALVHAPGRLLDAPIHAPLRGQLTGTEHMATAQLAGVPVAWLTGNPVLAMNVEIFASYLLAALAMRALLRAYGCLPAVAWAGGVVLALGAFRVPANVQSLQYACAYPALALWAVRRLRDEPGARRTALLAVVVAAGMLASYHLLPLVLLVTGIATALELAREREARGRFVAEVAAALAMAAVPVVLVSIPWLRRGDAGFAAPVGGLATMSLRDVEAWATALGGRLFGAVIPALAVAGLALAWWNGASARRTATAGIVLMLVGFVLVIEPPPLPALIAASPLRYLRAQIRFTMLAGVGLTLLAAAGLETAARMRTIGARTALPALGALAVILTRGLELSGARDEVRPLSVDRPVYEMVASVTAGQAQRPLLEMPLVDAAWKTRGSALPLGTLETDAMLGGLVHHCPLVTGHSAYPPAHRPFVDRLIARLPGSLDDLVDATDVGWVLLRPPDYWRTPDERAAMLRQALLRPVAESQGWTLLAVGRSSRHPDWVAAIAAGPRADATILGTPLRPVRLDDAGAQLRADAPSVVPEHALLAVRVVATNTGDAAWPVLARPGADDAPVVGIVARWDTGAEEEVAFARDVLPGESQTVPALLRVPGGLGDHEVTLRLAQAGTASSGAVATRLRVTVNY